MRNALDAVPHFCVRISCDEKFDRDPGPFRFKTFSR